MTTPLLIAETPRAGKLLHRFLVPTGTRLSGEEAVRLVAPVRGVSPGVPVWGDTYVGLCRKAPQQNGRSGDEILVLAEIDTARLSDEQKERLVSVLAARLDDLGVLVTQTVDWNRQHSSQLIVERPELRSWIEDDEFLRSLPRRSSRRRVAMNKVSLSVAGTLVLLGMLLVAFSGKVGPWINDVVEKVGTVVSKGPPETPPDKDDAPPPADVYEAFLNALGLKDEPKARSELFIAGQFKARHFDENEQALFRKRDEEIERRHVLESVVLRRFLEDSINNGRVDPCAFLGDAAGTLRDQPGLSPFGLDDRAKLERVVRLRRDLRRLAAALRQCRAAAIDVKASLNPSYAGHYLEMLKELTSERYRTLDDSPLFEDQAEPVLPLLNQDEAELVQLTMKLLDSRPARELVWKQVDGNAAAPLPSFLTVLTTIGKAEGFRVVPDEAEQDSRRRWLATNTVRHENAAALLDRGYASVDDLLKTLWKIGRRPADEIPQ